MKKIVDFLEQLGLTKIEARLYHEILKVGPTTVKEVAESIGINRVTAHFQIDELIKKGIVAQTMKGSRRQIIAESPERLSYLIEQKLDTVKNLQTKFPDFLNTVQTNYHQSKKNEEVGIKYYEGITAVRNIYKDALNSDEFRSYVNCRELAKIFPENVSLFIKTHKKRKGMKVWEIMEDSLEARAYAQKMPKSRYYYKFIPKGMNLSIIDYMIFDGKVGIVDLEKNTTGIVITNINYYQNAKALFEFVWQMLG